MYRVATLAAIAIATQAGAQSKHWPHNYDLLDVNWSVVLSKSSSAFHGDVTNTILPKAGAKSASFDCGPMKILGVTVEGKQAKWSLANNRLDVALPPSAPGARLAVRIRYDADPTAGLYYVAPQQGYPAKTPVIYTQGEMEDTRYWMPTYDYPDDKATSKGTIDVPASWSVLSNGALQGVTRRNGRAIWHWSMPAPHSTYLNSLVAGPYTEVVSATKPVPVSYWVPNGLTAEGRTSFGFTPKIVSFYGRLTGVKYPYAKFAQGTVPDFMFGGMENITAVTQTISTLHPASDEPLANSEGLVAHELAHQWFGDLVTTANWSHTWLNEGWATFLPAFWEREARGKEAFDLARLGILNGAQGAQRNGGRPMIWTGYEEPMDMFDGHAYAGGAARMFMLMHKVGEKRFWPAITRYLHEFAYKNATTESFFNSVSRSLGVDLDQFRKQWFYNPGAVSLRVHKQGTDVVVENSTPGFEIDTEALELFPGGGMTRVPIHIGAKPAVLRAKSPMCVLIDPEVWLMADIRYDMGYSADDWMRLYAVAPNSAEKSRILSPMFAELSPDQKLEMARKEKSPDLLADMIRMVGSADFSIEETHNPSRKVEQAAVSSLSTVDKSDAVVARLREIYEHDPSELMRESALRAYIAQTEDKVAVEAAWHMDSFNERFRTFALGWWTVHDADRARDTALAVLAGDEPEPVRIQAIRTLGDVKDKPGEHRVFDELIHLVDQKTIGERQGALTALGQYGDKAAIPHIEPLLRHSLHFVRRHAKQVLESLK